MKQFFTLLLTIFFSVSANSETTYTLTADAVYANWNYDSSTGTSTNQNTNGHIDTKGNSGTSGDLEKGVLAYDDVFTFYNNGNNLWTFNSASETWPLPGLTQKTLGYVMRAGGSCSFSDDGPLGPAIAIKVTGKCQIQIGARSNISSSRKIAISTFSNNVVTQIFEMEVYAISDTYDGYLHYTYDGDATTLLIYSTNYTVDFGIIRVVYPDATSGETSSWDSTDSTGTVIDNGGTGVSGDGGDAISSITVENATEIARYNIAGQKINGPQRGINIIKFSDGTTQKVVVK